MKRLFAILIIGLGCFLYACGAYGKQGRVDEAIESFKSQHQSEP